MGKQIFVAGTFLFLFFTLSCDSSSKLGGKEGERMNDELTNYDKMFLEIASSAGIMEVELGKLAAERGSREEVIAYGKMMIDEHSKINEEFRKLLENLNVTVPNGMNERNLEMVKEHAALTGQEFDSKYVQTMIDDHKLATEKFQEALSVAKNEEYKKFLASMIPIVRMHYEMAQELRKKI